MNIVYKVYGIFTVSVKLMFYGYTMYVYVVMLCVMCLWKKQSCKYHIARASYS